MRFTENKKYLYILIAALLVGIFSYSQYKNNQEKTSPIDIIEYHIEDNNLVVELDDSGSCLLSDEFDENGNWVATNEDYSCIIPIEDYQTNLYVRNKYNYLITTSENLDLSYAEKVEITSGDVYLALNGTEKVTYDYSFKGTINDEVKLQVEDESIATLDEDGYLHGESVGTTNLLATYADKTDSIKITVTDLIVVAPAQFDVSKPYLRCGRYSKEENDLLDEILASRIEKAGYQTRAGVVEAARFLALEFPYRINYFIENGRIASYVNNYGDGEGRYYHLGLYLDPSRYENLNKDMINSGPGCWGCSIYEYTKDRYSNNGLDCSGFVSWALLNGGFDCTDLGAGIAEWLDLTDLGEKKVLSEELKEDKLRVGDLLSGPYGGTVFEGGHIAIVAGIDKDGYIYVAEELGYANAWGYFIKKYDKNSILHSFYYRIDMDDYYQGKDGNLKDYWMDEN